MIEGVRAQLTAWYVTVLAVTLIVFELAVYAVLSRTLHARIDESLAASIDMTTTSLSNDIAEGQSRLDAARATVDEISSRQVAVAVFDTDGRLLASRELDEFTPRLPNDITLPDEIPHLFDSEEDDGDDAVRVAIKRVQVDPAVTPFVVHVSTALDELEDELSDIRRVLLSSIPLVLFGAGAGGWFLARKSLRPVTRAFQERQRFMEDASHELKTPLATIRAATDVTLQQASRTAEEYREALRMVDEQAVRLSRIVEDMFTLARADAGPLPLQRSAFYLDELLADIAAAASLRGAARHVSVQASGDRDVRCVADEDLIRRLVTNLVDNALKYSPPGERVDVKLARVDDLARIAVSDRGPGIPAHARPHVFERFYRADRSRVRAADTSGPGAGLGLAIARSIADAHGGRMMLANSAERGTTVIVELPCSELPRL